MILLGKVSEELGLFSHNILMNKTNSLDSCISKVNYTAYNFRVGAITIFKMLWSNILQYSNASCPAHTDGDTCSYIK